MPRIPDEPITFTCALEARRETVYFLAKLIGEHCERAGTRHGTRGLGPFRHAVLVLHWFLDATRGHQLAADNHIAVSTCHDRLHEAIYLLAALATCESEDQIPTLTDLGYLNLSPAIRHPHNKPRVASSPRRRPRTTRSSASCTA